MEAWLAVHDVGAGQPAGTPGPARAPAPRAPDAGPAPAEPGAGPGPVPVPRWVEALLLALDVLLQERPRPGAPARGAPRQVGAPWLSCQGDSDGVGRGWSAS
jgi:hypothetical protein